MTNDSPTPPTTPPAANWWCRKCGWFDADAKGPVPHDCPAEAMKARLDAEAATKDGCSRCGFMSLVGHDCPTAEPPAIPDEVEAALAKARGAFSMFSHAEREDALNMLENHITAQAREIERLREGRRCSGCAAVGATVMRHLPSCSQRAGEIQIVQTEPNGMFWGMAVLPTESLQAREATDHAAGFAEGLRWVLARGGYVTYPLECDIRAELARREGGGGSASD